MRYQVPPVLAFAVTIFGLQSVFGQAASYQPLGTCVNPQTDAFLQWDATRRMQVTRAVEMQARPQLAGLRPKAVELLQDGLRRKSSKITTDAAARRHILRLSSTRPGMNVLNGTMAEAMFADRNPRWNYVRSPNAPQNDFTQVRPGGGRNNVQVKFHENGSPARYMADMKKDWRATKFAVPDDHVDTLKTRLEAEYQRCKAAGNLDGARRVARQMGRVRGIGASSQEIIAARNQSVGTVAREQYSTYVSFGASLALALGPNVWDWANGNIAGNQALYRTTRALSLLGVGVGADALLATVKEGALRGTFRGNAIVGTALGITEVTWLMYEHGWQRAFYQPQFYESIGGSVTGIVCGMVGAGAAVAWIPGPGWVVGGSAFIAGAGLGTVGYIGGRSATTMILDIFAPEMVQQRERDQIASARSGIEQRMAEMIMWPPK